ncbi:hypothetical protein CAPTEDRAFT_200983 [Capitella teleta]|uniref:Uncharacterized protein n=1 Tax=Capitella teleta TaxID=283909 RepID=R7UII6_CAPTE|nr:hypothetical protein CAPTEDRAFT_200983 [Capitella teleta]|eukprot:ELU03077.1 hypothetical protein CAPTEDRAFT_200983 [Capitella teleta]
MTKTLLTPSVTPTQPQRTTFLCSTTTEKSDPALAIGSSVGGLICVATIVIMLIALYIHRKRQPSSATSDQNNQTGNVYEEISEISREMHPYQPVMQSQMNNAQNKLTSNPVYESSAPNSHPLEGQRAVYENTMRVSKATSDETGHI